MTCLVYLNPNWQPGDGGELQLLPFLNGDAVTIAPRMDTAVLFLSDRLLHRVLPVRLAMRRCTAILTSPPARRHAIQFCESCWIQSITARATGQARAERFCFTIWIDADGTNADDDVFLRPHHLELQPLALAELMAGSALQRVVSRAVYSEEYAESLKECMGVSQLEPSLQAALQTGGGSGAGVTNSPSLQAVLAAHSADVERMQQTNGGAMLPMLAALRALKQNGQPGGGTGEPQPQAVVGSTACAHCGLSTGPPCKRCGRCARLVYCDRACQRLHWLAAHRHECVLARCQ